MDPRLMESAYYNCWAVARCSSRLSSRCLRARKTCWQTVEPLWLLAELLRPPRLHSLRRGLLSGPKSAHLPFEPLQDHLRQPAPKWHRPSLACLVLVGRRPLPVDRGQLPLRPLQPEEQHHRPPRISQVSPVLVSLHPLRAWQKVRIHLHPHRGRA